MEKELFDKFQKLSTNDKRNVFNEEMRKIFELIIAITKIQNGTEDVSSISNYDSNKDKNISEDQYLCMMYKDLINIRKALINYLGWNHQL